MPAAAYANTLAPDAIPSGGHVVNGQATFSYEQGQLGVHQATDKVLINWQSFDIGQNAGATFYQPGQSAIAVNRVVGGDGDPTQILGSLKANGQVVVLDPNGIIFGSNSHVDVGGLIASTGQINEQKFNDTGQIEITNATGSIENLGSITVSEGGMAAFVAPHLENNGYIEANLGTVELAAGTAATIDLYGDGLLELAVDSSQIEASISQNGSVKAAGGRIALTVGQAGHIVDSIISTSGYSSASSVSTSGGKIILGGAEEIVVAETAKLDASGHEQAGTIHIGGAWQGKGNHENAKRTTIEAGAQITAQGGGGEVVVWADGHTHFAGDIKAKGSRVETSGKQTLRVTGQASVVADSWLLDPHNVRLIRGSGTDASGGTVNASGDSEDIDIATIETALMNNVSVLITTGASGVTQDGDITVVDTITANNTNNISLTLQAANSIIFTNADSDGEAPGIIAGGTGKLAITLNSDNDMGVADGEGAIFLSGATLTSNGGDIIMGGGADPLNTAAQGTAVHNDGVYLSNTEINSGVGTISIRGDGYDDNIINGQDGIEIQNGTTLTTSSGHIKLYGVGGDGDDDNRGVFINGTNDTKLQTATGDIYIEGTGNGADFSNHGVEIVSGAQLITNSASTANGTITIKGTGADQDDNNHGVIIQSADTLLQTNNSVIHIEGTGRGPNDDNRGVIIQSGANIITQSNDSAGGADIIIEGIGSATGTNNNYGIEIFSPDTLIQTGSGDIKLDGTGGGSGDTNYGIYITGNAIIKTTTDHSGQGNIELTGIGGDGTNHNRGISIDNSDTLIQTNAGSITLDGTARGSDVFNFGVWIGGDATLQTLDTNAGSQADITITAEAGDGTSSNYGVELNNANILTQSGSIEIEGTGKGGGNSNHGIFIQGSTEVKSNTSHNGDGVITLTGIAADGGGNRENSGIRIESLNTLIQTLGSDIKLDGTANGVADYNRGVVIQNAPNLISTSGNIEIIGTGSTSGTDHNMGIDIRDSTTRIETATGQITLEGTGKGSTWRNYGVQIFNAQLVTNSSDGGGEGNIKITGTGGDVNNDRNYGINIQGGNALIQTNNSTIEIKGTAQGDLINNQGIRIADGAKIISQDDGPAGGAHIKIEGDGSATGTNNNYGIEIFGPDTLIQAGSGNITLTGNGGGTGSNNFGVFLDNQSVVKTTTAHAGRGNISVTGKSGNGTTGGWGIYLDDSGTLIETQVGRIEMTGTGRSTTNNSIGILIIDSSTVRTHDTSAGTNADIILNGTAETGVTDAYGVQIARGNVVTQSGSIEIDGTSNGTGSNNNAVFIHDTSQITSNTSHNGDGTIKIQGESTDGTSDNRGVYIVDDTVLIQTLDSNIEITGEAGGNGTADDNFGLLLHNADIKSTGGAITLTGIGGDGTFDNHGVYVIGSPTEVSTVSGNIKLDGTGGTGGDTNFGVVVVASDLLSTTGNITLEGESNGTGNVNRGVYVEGGAQIKTNSTDGTKGIITLTGTGGNGAENNRGVELDGSGTLVQANASEIKITGTGRGSAWENHGVIIENDVVIKTTDGGSAGTADITIKGTGGNGTRDNVGVYIANTGTTIQTDSGSISIEGTGNGNDRSNQGVEIAFSTLKTITSHAGQGNIDIKGTGGTLSSDYNYGVFFRGGNGLLQTQIGNITVEGTGGGVGDYSSGIEIADGFTIETLGTGGLNDASITLEGHGATNGIDYAHGVDLVHGLIETNTGAVTIKGIGGGGSGGHDSYGVQFNSNSHIKTATATEGLGNISIEATGGTTGANHDGFRMSGHIETHAGDIDIEAEAVASGGGPQDGFLIFGSSLIETVDGDIDIKATYSGSYVGTSYGFRTLGTPEIKVTGNGSINIEGTNYANGGYGISISQDSSSILGQGTNTDITLRTNNLNIPASTIETTGDLFLVPLDSNAAITIGDDTADFGLSDTEFGRITADGRIVIGDRSAGSGAVTIDTLDISADTFDLEVFGGSIDVDGLTMGTGDVTLVARTGDVTNSVAIAYDKTADINLLASGNVRADASIQNNGTGAVNLVSGWDLSTGYNSDSGFTMTSVMDDKTSFGNGSGSVFINKNAGALNGVAVGSRQGATNVAGHNLTIQAGDDSGEYSLLGYHSDGNRTGSIKAYLSANLNIIAGSDAQTYAQIGHGGYDSDGDFSGTISVSAANLELIADATAVDAYAMIGHGAANTPGSGNRSGHVDVDIGGEISAVSGTNADWWIGHRTSGGGSLSSANLRLEANSFDNTAGTGAVNFDTGNTHFGTVIASNLEGGNVTLAVTGGNDLIWNGSMSANQSNDFYALASSNLTINQAMTNTGSGTIWGVAGWDGTSGLVADATTNSALIASNGGTLTIGNSGSILSNANDTAVVLVAEDGVTNQGSATSVNSPNGKSLIYAGSYTTTIRNGLAGDHIYGQPYSIGAPATYTGSDDIFFFNDEVTLTIQANTITGSLTGTNAYTFNVSGLVNGDSQANALTGTPSFSIGNQLSVDRYQIIPAGGSLVSPKGYNLAFVNGILQLSGVEVFSNSNVNYTSVEHRSSNPNNMAKESTKTLPRTTQDSNFASTSKLRSQGQTDNGVNSNTVNNTISSNEQGSNMVPITASQSCLVINGITGSCIIY